MLALLTTLPAEQQPLWARLEVSSLVLEMQMGILGSQLGHGRDLLAACLDKLGQVETKESRQKDGPCRRIGTQAMQKLWEKLQEKR